MNLRALPPASFGAVSARQALSHASAHDETGEERAHKIVFHALFCYIYSTIYRITMLVGCGIRGLLFDFFFNFLIYNG
jgi:hypothetical protein